MLKQELKIDLEIEQIQQKLVTFSEADVIEQGVADIEFRGLQDGTLNLILRNRFEKEIKEFEPPSDLKSEFSTEIEDLRAKNRQLRGKLNNLSSKMAEHQRGLLPRIELKNFSYQSDKRRKQHAISLSRKNRQSRFICRP